MQKQENSIAGKDDTQCEQICPTRLFPIFWFELETARRAQHYRPTPGTWEQLLFLHVLLRQKRPDWDLDVDGPRFYPKRVIVSQDVLNFMGTLEVLFYLNQHAFGEWNDVGDGFCEGRVKWSAWKFTKDVELLVCTSVNEARTVIRFTYERSESRRRRKRERTAGTGDASAPDTRSQGSGTPTEPGA